MPAGTDPDAGHGAGPAAGGGAGARSVGDARVPVADAGDARGASGTGARAGAGAAAGLGATVGPEAGAGTGGAPKVLLDACVLYPPVLREIVVGCAAAGLLRPIWSPRILAEWAHAAGRGGAEQAARTAAAIAALRAAFPAAEVLPEAATEAALELPDPADRHVLAAALDGGADLLLTLNLRDFPRRALAPHGLRAEPPDTLLLGLWLAHPAPVAAAVRAALGPDRALRAGLKRAGLPRLGRAMEAGA